METQCKEATLKEIELLRNKLTQTINNKGYSDKKTIEISQQLDKTLNYYNYLQQDKLHEKL